MIKKLGTPRFQRGTTGTSLKKKEAYPKSLP